MVMIMMLMLMLITIGALMMRSLVSKVIVKSRIISSTSGYCGKLFNLAHLADHLICLYFRRCNLSPCRVDNIHTNNINNKTSMVFWTTTQRRRNSDRPNLVLIHGYGGNPRFQFLFQIRSLSESFNLFVPDLLFFFGGSHTDSPDRSDRFQAECVAEGMRRLGVDRYGVVGLSYGGFVAFWMAADDLFQAVERVVMVSCGVVHSQEKKEEMLNGLGRSPLKLLIPETPSDVRDLVNYCSARYRPFDRVPDFILQRFINGLEDDCKLQRRELLEHILNRIADSQHLPVFKKKTLLVWGDTDRIFPLYFANQLQRHLGANASLHIINNCGHAANFDAPHQVNHLIKSFMLT